MTAPGAEVSGGGTRRPPGWSVLRTAGALLLGGAVALACLVAVAVIPGSIAVLAVPSASMEPAVPLGAVVVAARVEAEEVEIGDVIVFRAPGDDHLVVHRVVDVGRDDGAPSFATKGDANDARDAWLLRLDDGRAHRVRWTLPHVGGVLATVHRLPVRLALLMAGGSLLAVVGLRVIWAPPAARRPAGHRRRVPVGRVVAVSVVAAGVLAADAGAAFVGDAPASAAVSSASLPTTTGAECRWVSATQLRMRWDAPGPSAAEGHLVEAGSDPGGPHEVVATATPAGTTEVAFVPTAPLTTPRHHRVRTFRSPGWTGPPSASLISSECPGAIRRLAGTGTSGFAGDGGPALDAQLDRPRGVAVLADGSVLVADTGNHRIRRVAPDGTVTTLAGGGPSRPCSWSGPVSSLGLSSPSAVALDPTSGDLVVADTGAHCVRRIDTSGAVTTVAGGGTATACVASGPADAVRLRSPGGVAVDATGAVYVADTTNACVRRVAGGVHSHVLGGGGTSACLSSGPSTSVSLSGPTAVAVAADGSVIVADTGRNCVRRSAAGTYTHVLGGGGAGGCGSGGAATGVALSAPEGVAVDGAGRVVVTDRGRRCVRLVDGPVWAALALTGANGATGDDGPALGARMRQPSGVTVAPDGSVHLTDRSGAAGGSVVRSVVGPLR